MNYVKDMPTSDMVTREIEYLNHFEQEEVTPEHVMKVAASLSHFSETM